MNIIERVGYNCYNKGTLSPSRIKADHIFNGTNFALYGKNTVSKITAFLLIRASII